jgi:hypothetical protein
MDAVRRGIVIEVLEQINRDYQERQKSPTSPPKKGKVGKDTGQGEKTQPAPRKVGRKRGKTDAGQGGKPSGK